MTLPVRVRHDKVTPQPWQPFAELRRLSDAVTGWLDGIPTLDGIRPRTELHDTDDAYVVELHLPGVRKRDIDISLAGRRLTVSGEHKQRAGILRRKTRSVERFRCDVLLPGQVDEDGVHADLDDGVLTITVPKAASERRRRIEVR